MKVITLLPAKNEAWVLPTTLKNMSDFSDHIVIADQQSTDGSVEIYKQFEKVEIIENKNKTHNNSVRWQLLEHAREKYGAHNLIVCVDADEMIQPQTITYIKKYCIDTEESVSFTLPWIQLWGTIKKHRVDSVWNNNNKAIIFFDDGIIDYNRTMVLNDHTSRIPTCSKNITLDQFPLLHYQYIYLKQAEIKQVWYRCSELISGNTPRKINHKYSVAKNNTSVILEPTKLEWLQGLPEISYTHKLEQDWRYTDILSWFEKYSIIYFESLDIWDIPELQNMFIQAYKRKPRPQKYPVWIIWLNNLKNKFKKII